MSVIPITPDRIEVTTLLLQPSQSFSSSSFGMTGSISFNQRPSRSIRTLSDVTAGSAYTEASGITSDSDLLYSASESIKGNLDTDISGLMSAYLDAVKLSSIEQQQFSETYPVRFASTSSVEEITFDSDGDPVVPSDRGEWTNFQRRVIKDCLVPLYRNENHISHYAYTNYHSISFVSSSNFGTGSALVYPNFIGLDGIRSYTPAGDFTLDFFVKPTAPVDSGSVYRAGTIFHISSSICVSLISGSSLGPDQKSDAFRILLQLSRSADVAPSKINADLLPLSSPADLVFATSDVLKRDAWHRVTIKWATNLRNYGTGTIQVDDYTKVFAVPSASISTSLNSDALVIGNYYNSGQRNGSLFNINAASTYGVEQDPSGTIFDPTGIFFNHQLNAEIHNISFFKRFLTNSELRKITSLYLTSSEEGGPNFLLGPYFTSSIPAPVSTYFTPNILDAQSTDSPISYRLALGYNSNFLNLQNFTVDFANIKQGRAYGMSEGVAVAGIFDSRADSIDNFLMSQKPNRARNFSIIPCDDGNFEPDFSILESDSSRFKSLGVETSNVLISMSQLAPPGISPIGLFTNGIGFGTLNYDGSDRLLPLFQDANYLSVKFPDVSSNTVLVFSIPSIYYMSRIVPGTFVLTDSNVSGSGGLSFTLRDDERGNLYRSNTVTAAAKWNKVGSIFYNHGIAAIFSPHIPFFGKKSYEMSFRGEMRRTVANISVPADPDAVNLSHNSTYVPFPPTQSTIEQSDNFNYITGINLHDENLNIIMRAKLAQAVQKREGDEIVFRLRYDF